MRRNSVAEPSAASLMRDPFDGTSPRSAPANARTAAAAYPTPSPPIIKGSYGWPRHRAARSAPIFEHVQPG